MKVKPRWTSKEYKLNLDRDYNASLNILMWGWDSLKRPVEMESLRGLIKIPASSVEAGSSHPSW